MSLLCFTLGSNKYINVPWVAEFVGVSAHGLESSAVTNTTNDELANLAGEITAVRSAACADPRVACTQGDVQAAIDQVLYEMPTVAGILLGEHLVEDSGRYLLHPRRATMSARISCFPQLTACRVCLHL